MYFPLRRTLLVLLLLLAVAAMTMAVRFDHSRWVTTAGLLCDIAGILQISTSEWFQRVFDHYLDEERFPNGPPSHVARRLIDLPHAPVTMALRRLLYYDGGFGFALIIAGSMLQLAGTWMPSA